MRGDGDAADAGDGLRGADDGLAVYPGDGAPDAQYAAEGIDVLEAYPREFADEQAAPGGQDDEQPEPFGQDFGEAGRSSRPAGRLSLTRRDWPAPRTRQGLVATTSSAMAVLKIVRSRA